MASYRREKLEELIRRVVAESLLKEVKDPRIGFVTVTRVSLSKDYGTADVYVSVIGDESEKKLTMAGINSARSFIQHIVGGEVRLRIMPRIVFHLDTSIEEGVNLVGLIDSANPRGDE
ncbi:MAG TPA: 30S ribosome-binding factor RbfA [Spirochaetota bacterium]|nr:30S ribosome-binding factor RbfA [Spirochaetota bacterium]HNT12331.1 30S ribosome-binding factor RbfA [Spirochaetota bacterium]